MKLTYKYIKINANNAECVIKILYSKGYKWTAVHYDINEAIDFNNEHIYNYVVIFNNMNFTFAYCHDGYEDFFGEIDVNILLRETKLKRILK